MKRFLLILCSFIAINIYADHHKKMDKDAKERFSNNPNYLMSFKECNEIKEGVGGLLALSETAWKEIEINPENEDAWLEASLLADMAANYSTMYQVWCKDMVNHRLKMRKMAGMKDKDKKKDKKEKKDN